MSEPNSSPSPEPTPKNIPEKQADPIPLYWTKGVATTFRGPLGLKGAIDRFLHDLAMETGIEFSRNEFILNALRFYLRHLMQCKTEQEMIARCKERFKVLDDEPKEERIEGEVEEK